MTDSTPNPAPAPRIVIRKPVAPYQPAIMPWLRPLLWGTFVGFALLGASGAYLSGVTFLNWLRPQTLYTTPFTFWMFLAHGGIGLLGTLPFLAFGAIHYFTSRHRNNVKAVRLGLLVFGLGIAVILTGVALFQFTGMPQLPTGTLSRSIIYWLHVVIPFGAVWAYIGHRKAGPRIKWEYGRLWAGGVTLLMVVMALLHTYDPTEAARKGSKDGVQYFEPSLARTGDGKFIPTERLMNDQYCVSCHADIANDHLHSAHKFSSFNNPAYLFSVKETREVGLKRDGHVKSSRWCAGCHDPVPFFSGQFDDPTFDFEKHETGHAGITCLVCHSMTNIHGPQGNAAYTIESQQQYPFAFSENAILQWINNQMVKAKPEFHKKTMLRPLHKSAEFCSTCHKVALPVELNHYKDFLRGQNHYDSFVLSGMGNGSRSFYFPEQAKENCASCHMPLKASGDFGAKDFDGSGTRKIHHHSFPAANTGLFTLLKDDPKYQHLTAGLDKTIALNTDFLKDQKLRIDLFGVKSFRPDGSLDDASLTVLRPKLPVLVPGQTYSIEVVIRTLQVGHHFSQGTVDSNEIWVDFEAKSGSRVIGRNGALQNPDETGAVDEWSHFINVHMLDRTGKRIDRRNPQDIFTPLYDHQIPPGAANVVHYRLTVPKDVVDPIQLTVKLRYRKFDQTYMEYVHKPLNRPVPKLPIVDICTDTVTLPVGQDTNVAVQESPIKPVWQRWNDFGIGSYLEGGAGNKRGNLRQAESAFRSLLATGVPDAQWHGHANLARIYIDTGRLNEAAQEIEASAKADPPAPWWLRAWLSGLVSVENATTRDDWDRAIQHFATIVDPANRPVERKMNFSKDYVVLGRLAQAYYRRAQLEPSQSAERRAFLSNAVETYERALAVDPEDLASHFGIAHCLNELGSTAPVIPSNLQKTSFDELVKGISESSGAERLVAAGLLTDLVTELGRQSPNVQKPRHRAFVDAVQTLRPIWRQETDEPTKATLALALAALHRELYSLMKPDELARAAATKIYRANHPAANAAAEAIVYYPTDRFPGATK